MNPNRISSSGRGRPKRFNLDRRQWLVLTGRFRTMVNCNPDCNPSLRTVSGECALALGARAVRGRAAPPCLPCPQSVTRSAMVLRSVG
jgi:hypothetical protein